MLLVWGLLVVLAIALGVGLTIWRFRVQQQRMNGLSSVILPDGGRLIIETVSFGKSHKHIFRKGTEFRIPLIRQFGEREIATQVHSVANRYAVFFRRVDAKGKTVDLDWWGGCELKDGTGRTFRQLEVHRISATMNKGMSTMGSDLPFPPMTDRYDFLSGEAEFPAIPLDAHQATLDFLDRDGKLLATVELPVSSQGIPPTWDSEPLPIRRTVAGVDVALESLTVKQHDYQTDRGMQTWYSLDRKWSLQQDGKPTTAWKIDSENAQDEAGESGLPPRSWNMPTWKLTAILAPTDPAAATVNSSVAMNGTPSSQTWKAIPITAANSNIERTDELIVAPSGEDRRDLELKIDRVGQGSSTWSGTSAMAGGHYGTSAGDPFGLMSFHVSSSSNTGWTISVQTDHAWMRLHHRQLEPDERIEFALVDDQGRSVPFGTHRNGPKQTLLHLDPFPDSKSLDLTVYALRVYPFEMFVAAPPKP
jgi:hypothetical protein